MEGGGREKRNGEGGTNEKPTPDTTPSATGRGVVYCGGKREEERDELVGWLSSKFQGVREKHHGSEYQYHPNGAQTQITKNKLKS
jgi:hypothetical protein